MAISFLLICTLDCLGSGFGRGPRSLVQVPAGCRHPSFPLNENDDIKIILLHGGSFFSSGNDLGAFADAFKNKESPAKMLERADYGVNKVLTGMLIFFLTVKN